MHTMNSADAIGATLEAPANPPSEAAARALFEALPTVELDLRAQTVAASPAFLRLHGLAAPPLSLAALHASLAAAAVHPEDAGEAQAAAAVLGGCPTERIYALRDGRYIRTRILPLAAQRALRLDVDVTSEQLLQRRVAAAVQAIRGVLYEFDVAADRAERFGDCETLLGYTPDAMPTTGAWWRAQIEPEDLAAVEENAHAAAAMRAPSVSNEYRFRHRDGRWIWLWDNALLEYAPDGSVRRMLGCTLSICERKRAEEHVGLLMQELTHRAKNLLAVVQAVANHAARDDERGAPFVQRFTQRLAALAACHDLLVRNHWRGAELADLAHSQFAPFADLLGWRIRVEGPTLHLAPAAAQAIGMALHELATNAGKYGALSSAEGSVCFRWSEAQGQVEICWTEQGGPPVQTPLHTGFGHRVTVEMVELAVGGAVRLSYAASGLEWRLRAPAERLLAQT